MKKMLLGGYAFFLAEITGIPRENIKALSESDKDIVKRILDSLGFVGDNNKKRTNKISRREVVELRFGLDCKAHNLREIAMIYSVTPSAVRVHIAGSVRRLRNPLRLKKLENIAIKSRELESESFDNSQLVVIEDNYELSVRVVNILRNCNIITIADLTKKTESELLKMKNFGRKGLAELGDVLEAHGLRFSI